MRVPGKTERPSGHAGCHAQVSALGGRQGEGSPRSAGRVGGASEGWARLGRDGEAGTCHRVGSPPFAPRTAAGCEESRRRDPEPLASEKTEEAVDMSGSKDPTPKCGT